MKGGWTLSLEPKCPLGIFPGFPSFSPWAQQLQCPLPDQRGFLSFSRVHWPQELHTLGHRPTALSSLGADMFTLPPVPRDRAAQGRVHRAGS